MTDDESFALERKHPDIMVIDSRTDGLKYLFDADKSRFAIAGEKGIAMLTIRQAKALKAELDDILEIREVITERKVGGKLK